MKKLWTLLLLLTMAGILIGQNLNEGFEGITFPPAGWRVINGGGANTWVRYTTTPITGTASAAITYNSTAHNDWLITPKLSPITGNATIRFKAKNGSSTYLDAFNVKLSISGNDEADFTVTLASNIVPPTIATEYEYDLSDYVGQNVYVAVQAISADEMRLFVDDFEGPPIYTAPEPPTATTLVAPANEAININLSQQLSWNSVFGADRYKVYFGTDENNLVETELGNITTWTPLPALAYGQTYYWNVKAGNEYGYATATETRSFTTMADPTITALPYTESFENGNTHNSTTVLNWSQEAISGTSPWTINSTFTNYNRTPRTGSFNVTLVYNNSRWLFRPVQLVGGTSYDVELYARQDGATAANANIGIYYGDAATVAAMTNTIKAQTGLIGGDYQRIAGSFTPAQSGIYYIGIQGWINGTPWYISLDDITIAQSPDDPIVQITETVDFLASFVGEETAEKFVTITNIGGGVLSINREDVVLDDREFEMTSIEPQELTANQSVNIPVKFKPTSPGIHNAVITFTNNERNYTANLTGYGVAPGSLFEGFNATAFPPAGWANPGTWSRSTTAVLEGTGSAYKYTSTTHSNLVTPLLTITNNSTLRFYARTASTNTSQRIQIKYSADGTIWNNVGEEISLPASNNEWSFYEVDLSSLSTRTNNNYYIAFATYNAGTGGSVYLDGVVGPQITPLTPNPVTLNLPADEAVNVSNSPNLTWTPAATGGIPTSYKVYLDTNENPTTLKATVNAPASNYTVTPFLTYSTTYYWKVVAVNANGESEASPVRSFTVMDDPTIYAFPWTETFDTTPPAPNWTLFKGDLAVETALTVGSAWGLHNFGNTTGPNLLGAHINVYGTKNDWLITPPIDLNGLDNAVLDFDIALTPYYTPIVQTNLGPNDYVAVVISTDNGITWSNANILVDWDEDDTILPTGNNIKVDLSSYTGTVKLGFYAQRPSGTDPDLRFYVDNVTIREVYTGTDILTYSIPEQTGAAVIDNQAKTIAVEVGVGTDVTALVSTFTLSQGAAAVIGQLAQVSGVTANDFTDPVVYTVTAEDATTETWTVTVTVATTQSSENDILAYSFPNATPAVIDVINHTVAIQVPWDASLTNLVATFTLSPLANAFIEDGIQPDNRFSTRNNTKRNSRARIAQVSGVTVNDFTDPVEYIVVAEDLSEQVWTVTVTNAPRPAGSTCSNPYIVTLPVVDYQDNTQFYGNDYTSAMINPASSYLNGNDFVTSFTLTEPGYFTGSVAGNYAGLIIVNEEPGTPAVTRIGFAGTSTGGTISNLLLEAGTYYAIVSSWPSPQTIAFTLNMSFVPARTITFVVSEARSFIEGASVNVKKNNVNVATILTDEEGEAVFYLVDAEDYTYSVTKAGFDEISNVPFTVTQNTQIPVTMTALATEFSITPESKTFLTTKANPVSPTATVFTITNTGGGTMTINPSDISLTGPDAAQFTLTNITETAELAPNATVTVSVAYTPTEVGDHQAFLTIEDNITTRATIRESRTIKSSRAINNVALTGKTIPDNFLLEDFNATTFPPAGWQNPDGWTRSTFTTFEGTGRANVSTATTPKRLITPMLTITEDSSIKFFARTTTANTNQRIKIQSSTNLTDWTDVGTEIVLPSSSVDANYIEYTVDLSTLNNTSDNYFAIVAYNTSVTGTVLVDYVVGPQITPLTPNAVTLSSPLNAATNQSVRPTLSWTPASTGGIPTGYKIYLDTNEDPTTLIHTATTSPYTLEAALNFETVYYWKVVATNNSGDAPASAVRSFTTRSGIASTPSPANNAINVNITSKTLGWATVTGATGYKVTVGTSTGASDIVDNVLVETNSWTSENNWAYSTQYFWTVTSVGGNEVVGTEWNFTTMADPTITTFPYNEDFEGTIFPPNGWTNVRIAGTATGTWNHQTVNGTYPTCSPQSGTKMIRYNAYSYAAGTAGKLTTPDIVFPAGSFRVNFWMYHDPGYPTYTTEVVDVYFGDSENSLGTFQRYSATAGWVQHEVVLPVAENGETSTISFVGTSAYGNNIFIDNITIDRIPVYNPPTNLDGYAGQDAEGLFVYLTADFPDNSSEISSTSMLLSSKNSLKKANNLRNSEEPTSYWIYRDGVRIANSTFAEDAEQFFFWDRNVEPNTTYEYYVTARYGTEPNIIESVPSNTVEITTGQTTVTQTINLSTGWNMVSFNVQLNATIEDIFGDLANEGKLALVISQQGDTYEYFEDFEMWWDFIEDIVPSQGYMVRVYENCQLEVQGSAITLPLTIPLQTGWNIISYPLSINSNVEDVFADLLASESLGKVINEQGDTYEYFEDFEMWWDFIENLEPNKAYWVRVNNECELIFTLPNRNVNNSSKVKIQKLNNK